LEDIFQIIEAEETPGILFDKSNGKLNITGKSLPEDAASFYLPVITWLNDYIKSQNNETEITFNLVYFNTASSKQLFKILTLLKELSNTQKVKIIWRYDVGDKDMLASGERFSKLAQLPIDIIRN
jgi:hypothetical protein